MNKMMFIKRMIMMNLTRKALVWATISVASIGAATAHTKEAGSSAVTHPWANPAKTGTSARLHVTRANGWCRTIHLSDMITPVAPRGRTMTRSDPEGRRSLGSVSMATGESLDPGTSHMRIQLLGRNRDLVEGGRFSANLAFASATRIQIDGAV